MLVETAAAATMVARSQGKCCQSVIFSRILSCGRTTSLFTSLGAFFFAFLSVAVELFGAHC